MYEWHNEYENFERTFIGITRHIHRTSSQSQNRGWWKTPKGKTSKGENVEKNQERKISKRKMSKRKTSKRKMAKKENVERKKQKRKTSKRKTSKDAKDIIIAKLGACSV